jgi:hypothetical protein
MAEQPTETGIGSPEYVAYLLMCSISRESHNTALNSSTAILGGKSKEWILDTYEECLFLVQRGMRKG